MKLFRKYGVRKLCNDKLDSQDIIEVGLRDVVTLKLEDVGEDGLIAVAESDVDGVIVFVD